MLADFHNLPETHTQEKQARALSPGHFAALISRIHAVGEDGDPEAAITILTCMACIRRAHLARSKVLLRATDDFIFALCTQGKRKYKGIRSAFGRALPRPAWWPPPAARRRLHDPVPAARRPPPPAGSGGPSSMVHGQSELRRPGLLPSRGLFDRPKRQAPAAHRQKQCVSTASLHKVHLRGRAERGFGRSRVSWRSSAIAFRLIRSG